jgi:hypothetical protein
MEGARTIVLCVSPLSIHQDQDTCDCNIYLPVLDGEQVTERSLGCYILMRHCSCGILSGANRERFADTSAHEERYKEMISMGYVANDTCKMDWYDAFGLSALIGCRGDICSTPTDHTASPMVDIEETPAVQMDLASIGLMEKVQHTNNVMRSVISFCLSIKRKSPSAWNVVRHNYREYMECIYQASLSYECEIDKDMIVDACSIYPKAGSSKQALAMVTKKIMDIDRYHLCSPPGIEKMDVMISNLTSHPQQTIQQMLSHTREISQIFTRMNSLKRDMFLPIGSSTQIILANTTNTIGDDIESYQCTDVYGYVDGDKLFRFTVDELATLIGGGTNTSLNRHPTSGRNFYTNKPLSRLVVDDMRKMLMSHPCPSLCAPVDVLLTRYITPKKSIESYVKTTPNMKKRLPYPRSIIPFMLEMDNELTHYIRIISDDDNSNKYTLKIRNQSRDRVVTIQKQHQLHSNNIAWMHSDIRTINYRAMRGRPITDKDLSRYLNIVIFLSDRFK